MADLATRVIEIYRDEDRDRYLNNVFRAKIVAGQYGEAIAAIEELRDLRARLTVQVTGASLRSAVANLQYELVARAMLRQTSAHSTLEASVEQAFLETLRTLDDPRAAALIGLITLVKYPSDISPRLSRDLARQGEATSISLPDAIELINAYQQEQAYRLLSLFAATLVAEDDQRRYVIDKDVLVSTPDGAGICATIFRPRLASRRLPALLNFSIYADPVAKAHEARLSAAHGYAGVVGFTRGKACSADQPMPIEHDGSDAASLIDWISRQVWSDGRVGMFGGSYDGFTQWAATKHLPKALKTIMPSVSFAPGIDFPQPFGIYQSYGYPWPFYTTDNKTLDSATYFDTARWDRLNRDWYVSGRAYRDLEKIDGKPNPIWERWLNHPSYDNYWRNAVPYGREFSRIGIPVLTTTGYYDDGQVGALHYFREHYRHRPAAEHYLVIGPYNHVTGQTGTVGVLGGPGINLRDYKIDPVAQDDIYELRYQWFDHIFKGAAKPPLLQDKVNYEVMGANIWKHAPSLAGMASERRKFYLSASSSGEGRLLSAILPTARQSIDQHLDLADRSDVEQYSNAGDNDTWNSIAHLTGKTLEIHHGVVFVSQPLRNPTEVSGLFSGHLRFKTNKRDFDFDIQLYELTPDGNYLQLSFFSARASLVSNPSQRLLLKPGIPQSLDFTSALLMSRLFQPGSRVVIVLSLVKQPNLQINYGTGKEVSDESIVDGKEPLEVSWSDTSFVELPIAQ
jgi:hypothetical protein